MRVLWRGHADALTMQLRTCLPAHFPHQLHLECLERWPRAGLVLAWSAGSPGTTTSCYCATPVPRRRRRCHAMPKRYEPCLCVVLMVMLHVMGSSCMHACVMHACMHSYMLHTHTHVHHTCHTHTMHTNTPPHTHRHTHTHHTRAHTHTRTDAHTHTHTHTRARHQEQSMHALCLHMRFVCVCLFSSQSAFSILLDITTQSVAVQLRIWLPHYEYVRCVL